MPVLIEETNIDIQWADLDARVYHPRPYPCRSHGVHISGILRYIGLTTKLLDPVEDEEDVTVMPLRMAMGIAWEEFAVTLYPKINWQPGEICLNYIYGSPDGLSQITTRSTGLLVADCVEEFKLTYYSHFTKGKGSQIFTRWMWMHQMRAYCHILNYDYARLHVLWVCGDYRPSSPLYSRYLIKFTKKEREETWRMLEQSRDMAVPE